MLTRLVLCTALLATVNPSALAQGHDAHVSVGPAGLEKDPHVKESHAGNKGDNAGGGKNGKGGGGGKNAAKGPSEAVKTQIKAATNQFVSDVLVGNALLGQGLLNAIMNMLGLTETSFVEAAQQSGNLTAAARNELEKQMLDLERKAESRTDREAVRHVIDVLHDPQAYKELKFNIKKGLVRFADAPQPGGAHKADLEMRVAKDIANQVQRLLDRHGLDSDFAYFTLGSGWFAQLKAHSELRGIQTAHHLVLPWQRFTASDTQYRLLRRAISALPEQDQAEWNAWVTATAKKKKHKPSKQFLKWLIVDPAEQVKLRETRDIFFWNTGQI